MKKKLFTLMTLLLCLCSGAWGDVITWNTAENSTSNDASLSSNYEFTADDGNTKMTYANPNGCKRLKNNGGLYMNGASQYNNSKNQRHFTFKAPSSTGKVSITFAAINGKTDGSSSQTADVKIYGGTTVAYTVTTLNSSLNSPTIYGLQTGTSDVIITFSAKCTIKEIKWTDVAAPTTYTTVYANDFTATPMGEAAVSYSSMSALASNISGWTGWASTYTGGYSTSASSGKATLTFATPLELASNGTDRGRIRIYWGHTSNGKTFSLKVNGTSATFSPTSVTTTLYPKVLNIAEYTIPDATTKISSIEAAGSSNSGLHLFRIEVLSYAAAPGTIVFSPTDENTVETGAEVTLSSANATTIKYQWGSSVVGSSGDWSGAETYSDSNKPEVPAYGSANNVLSVKASNNHGDTYGSATYSISAPAYTITKGTHANGDFTINPSSAAEGEEVTLTATPNLRYLFDTWSVYKTGDPTTTVTVTNNKFTMPAYAVTVDATFTADARKQILYLTTTSASDTKSNDKLYKALNSVDDYNVVIEAPASQTVTDYDLVVLHESLDGKTMYNNTVVAAAKSGNVPVLNTKTYFYSEGRWGWGTPDAGKSVNGATLNAAYSNTSSHPIFDGVTISEGFVEIIGTAADKAMQPVAPVSGKEGYLLATTPKSDNTPLTAIHELTPAQRGVSSAKYLLISVSSAKLNDLTENGQKLFKNAAAYLIDNSASWTPTVAVTKRNDRTYGTFVTTKALDFTNVTDMEAYIAKGLNGTSTAVTIKKVTKVPANTPIIVKTAVKTTASVDVPVTSTATAADVEGNLLVAGDGTTTWNGTAGYTYYYLANDEFHKGTSGTLQTGKAYLKVSGDPNSAKAMTLFIGEGETTGINGVEEVAPVTKTRKVVKNGRLVIETANGEYTVSGARVK